MDSPDLVPAPQDGAIVVLVVEDEFLVRFTIADELREAGLTVVEAANAAEAWAYLTSGGQVDVVFSDIQMPGAMNGIELARKLRNDYPEIPLLLTSGNIPAERVDGLAPFIRKPYRSAAVMSVISEILKRNR